MSLNAKPAAANAANNMSLSAPLNAVSSFVAAPLNQVKNFTSNVVTNVGNAANSVKNTIVNAPIVQDFAQPINDSFQQAFENNANAGISIPIILLLGALVIVFVLFVIFRDQITLGLTIAWEKLKSWVSPSTEPEPVPEPPSTAALPNMLDAEKLLPSRKQVFNIAENRYTYSDAEPLCKSMGAELATYDQVKEAWKKGADWCNYGWVKGQSAVYPTQQETYDKLQNGPEDQQMACGVPGINGGYFDNPDLRFGVNCYGAKPTETGTDERHMQEIKANVAPGALEYDRKVQEFKNHRDEIAINPFKDGVWSG